MVVKITCRHQEAKCVNASLKCSICSILVMFGFFHHFWAVVDAQSVKRTNFYLYIFLRPKNQYGQHGEIWVWLYKLLYSSEMVDIC